VRLQRSPDGGHLPLKPKDGGIEPPLQLPRLSRGGSAGRHP
jgi:hypothetical protein